MNLLPCHACQTADLLEHPRYQALTRVTSDCKPWPGGEALYSCRKCGCTQINCNQQWREEIQTIYKNYSIYYQSGGQEQGVFDQATGMTLPRSEWLLERISAQYQLPENGRALDIGCGNGRFLKAFGARRPRWRLTGTEYNEQNKSVVERLPQVDKLHAGPLSTLAGEYDFISLIHVLEHIPNPVAFLQEVASKLKPDGVLLVELPSYETNPFELLIADHATHYTLSSSVHVLNRSGFAVDYATLSWVPKEISIMARKATVAESQASASFLQVDESLDWLHHVSAQGGELSAKASCFGILGTSIAGTWLASSLLEPPRFFVDEDINRIGKTHLNVPIYSPHDIPQGATVFIVQPVELAKNIARRLARSGIEYVHPD